MGSISSRRRRWKRAAAGLALGLVGWLAPGVRPACAQLAAGETEWSSVEVHGFGGQGFIVSTGNDYLVPDSKRGSFQMSEVGINFSKALTEKLRFGVQFFAQNFGAAGNYTPQVDWFTLDYHWRDWLGLRAGRLKIPFGLYNEVNDIDSARVPILLPQSVYPLQARSFLFAQTGAEIYGFVRAQGGGGLEYRLYGGTVYIDPDLVVPVGTPVQLTFNVPYAYGGRLLWETPLTGLRMGASYLNLRLDSTVFLPMGVSAGIENHSWSWVSFAEYSHSTVTLTAEYGRGHSMQETILPGNTFAVTSDAGYVMGTWAASSWLQSALYYALKYPDVEKRKGLSNKQHDVSLTLRFDLNQHWLLKLEGHYMAGTTGLINPLRVGPPPADPDRRWAVFLAKTTVYF
jgi:hypothetical protein